jgi:DNA helicase-2/ATP-dependent DNA helicase PcrA
MEAKYVLRRNFAPRVEHQFRIDYRGELNSAQYEAVSAVEGPVLVIAGAGSGKTRTLVYRVAYLIEIGVKPESILLLTFTRKAAEEMLRRASSLVDDRCVKVPGGTFHSFAASVLRRHAPLLGYPRDFTILDRTDSEDTIQLIRAEMGFAEKRKRFPKKSTIAEIFSMSINKAVPLEDLLIQQYVHLYEHSEDFSSLWRKYDEYKRARGLMDYDDLLVNFKALLAANEPIQTHLSNSYRMIMVDEYQDTNKLQARIVRLLAATHDNVMAVGDDAQSIYSFRGANFRNIMDFPLEFPGTRIITLEENYRSTQPILHLTNEVISRASEKYTKVLFTQKTRGPRPVLVRAESENDQSRFVCQRVLELREEGIPLSEIAILFRSSYHSFDLEIELGHHDLPYIKRGGFKFIETAHVKDLLAFLRVLANSRDSVSWNRIFLLLSGIGARRSHELVQWVMEGEDPILRLESHPLSERAAPALSSLANLLKRISPSQMILSDRVGEIIDFYLPSMREKYRDDYPKRQRDLEHFHLITERYRSLESFLTDMALEPPGDSVGDVLAVDDDEGPLVLSTIHSAKGLEWHSVFVIWALEGKFPSVHSMHSEREIEEERRLMYVALTRAKENLFITYPIMIHDRMSGLVLSKPSRFVEEIPHDILEPISLIEEEDLEEETHC